VRNADYVLDMGPEGGERGGHIVAHGTPEQIATVAGSHTGSFLARHYKLDHASLNGSGATHAGAQPLDIIAAPDRVKTVRGKFVAPEKKTGVPTAQSARRVKKAVKRAAKKAAKKSSPIKRQPSA